MKIPIVQVAMALNSPLGQTSFPMPNVLCSRKGRTARVILSDSEGSTPLKPSPRVSPVPATDSSMLRDQHSLSHVSSDGAASVGLVWERAEDGRFGSERLPSCNLPSTPCGLPFLGGGGQRRAGTGPPDSADEEGDDVPLTFGPRSVAPRGSARGRRLLISPNSTTSTLSPDSPESATLPSALHLVPALGEGNPTRAELFFGRLSPPRSSTSRSDKHTAIGDQDLNGRVGGDDSMIGSDADDDLFFTPDGSLEWEGDRATTPSSHGDSPRPPSVNGTLITCLDRAEGGGRDCGEAGGGGGTGTTLDGLEAALAGISLGDRSCQGLLARSRSGSGREDRGADDITGVLLSTGSRSRGGGEGTLEGGGRALTFTRSVYRRPGHRRVVMDDEEEDEGASVRREIGAGAALDFASPSREFPARPRSGSSSGGQDTSISLVKTVVEARKGGSSLASCRCSPSKGVRSPRPTEAVPPTSPVLTTGSRSSPASGSGSRSAPADPHPVRAEAAAVLEAPQRVRDQLPQPSSLRTPTAANHQITGGVDVLSYGKGSATDLFYPPSLIVISDSNSDDENEEGVRSGKERGLGGVGADPSASDLASDLAAVMGSKLSLYPEKGPSSESSDAADKGCDSGFTHPQPPPQTPPPAAASAEVIDLVSPSSPSLSSPLSSGAESLSLGVRRVPGRRTERGIRGLILAVSETEDEVEAAAPTPPRPTKGILSFVAAPASPRPLPSLDGSSGVTSPREASRQPSSAFPVVGAPRPPRPSPRKGAGPLPTTQSPRIPTLNSPNSK